MEVNVFFFPRYMKGGRRRGERDTFRVFWKCFFHCEEAREGFTGGIFLQIHYGTIGRVHLDFFFFFFLIVERTSQ